MIPWSVFVRTYSQLTDKPIPVAQLRDLGFTAAAEEFSSTRPVRR